jgi:hypothetical protein
MELARDLDCVTAEVALNKDLDFTKSLVVYREVTRELRVPSAAERGIPALLNASLEQVRSKAAGNDALADRLVAGWVAGLDKADFEGGPHYNVARQQVASYIFQGLRTNRARAKVQDLLAHCAPPVLAAGLLDAMVQHDELREDARGLRFGDAWLDRQGSGEIHSTIEDQPGAAVVDEASGRTIARSVIFQGGRGLRAGGQLLEVRRWQDCKLEVRRVSDEALAQGNWRYTSRPWLRGAGQPQALRRYLGLPEDAWTVVDAGDDAAAYAFQLGGARRQAVLELLAAYAQDAVAPADITGWFLRLPTPASVRPLWLARANEPALAQLLPARLAEVRAWLRAARWETPPTPEAARLLCAFARGIGERGSQVEPRSKVAAVNVVVGL